MMCFFMLEFRLSSRLSDTKKGPPPWPNLVNLKSNTMKNTRANIERIYEFHKLFREKTQILNYV